MLSSEGGKLIWHEGSEKKAQELSLISRLDQAQSRAVKKENAIEDSRQGANSYRYQEMLRSYHAD